MAGNRDPRYNEGELVDRVSALARDWESGAAEGWGEDFTVGIVAVVYELQWGDGRSAVVYSSSDARPWIQAGLFRAALRFVESLGDGEV